MRSLILSLLCTLVSMAVCHGQAAAPARIPAVFAAYATPLEEPWNMVIHQALQAAEKNGRITYAWQDKLSSAEALVLGIQSALARRPDIVVADGVEGVEGIKAIAAAHPGISFVVGTSAAPAPPNVSVFDSNLSEPAYLCGVVAGRLTKSNIVGVVAGRSDVQVHRAINAYMQGVRETNPVAKVKLTFIDSWYDPPRAKQAAIDQVAAGADIIWAEREGAIAGAREKGALAFGNLVDQSVEGPDTVLTGPVWSMAPLIDHVAKLSAAGMIRGESYHDFSSLARGGAVLAPWHGWNQKLPPDVLELVREKQNAIKTGVLVINPSAERPVGN
ncbi:MAG: BMP family protein [Planctomycetia bacterium]|nr:BMP family protein [Planctomycetia bacterium]